MKKYTFLFAMIVLVCLLSVACGSEEENGTGDGDSEPENDGDIENAADADTENADGDVTAGDNDEVSDGDDDVTGEIDVEEDAEAMMSCSDFSGAYYLEGQCSSQLVSFFNFACVRQNENCEMELFTDSAAFSGTVSDYEFEISSTYSLSPTTCTGSQDSVIDPVKIDCEIPEYNITCSGDATPMPSIEDVSSTCCDVFAQNCPEGQRCTYVTSGTNRPYVTACIPVGGNKTEGEICTRHQSETAGVGRDNCEKGLFCANYGQETINTRVCMKFCDEDSDCAEGQGCINASIRVPRLGNCSNSCDQFGDGSECEGGNVCAMMTSINRENNSYIASGFCMPGGTSAPDQPCSYNFECTTGYVCSPFTWTCKNICDSEHPCPDETEECTSVMGYSYGICKD